MLYVTGTHALNVHDKQDTPGDWHMCSIDWDNPITKESSESVFGDWDIEEREMPNGVEMPVAGHKRAILDLLDDGYYGSAQGFRNNFLDDPWTTPIMMQKALLLKENGNWEKIDAAMGREYMMRWVRFKERNGI